jgi:hypothetical protein
VAGFMTTVRGDDIRAIIIARGPPHPTK